MLKMYNTIKDKKTIAKRKCWNNRTTYQLRMRTQIQNCSKANKQNKYELGLREQNR